MTNVGSDVCLMLWSDPVRPPAGIKYTERETSLICHQQDQVRGESQGAIIFISETDMMVFVDLVECNL